MTKDLLKERNFAGHFVSFFSKSLFVKPNHTLISTSELVSSLSAYEMKVNEASLHVF